MRLKDKVAIVTGSGSGLGRASALLFAKEGASVVVADISQEGGLQTVEMIRAGGGVATFSRADVSKAPDCESMVQDAVETHGRLDCIFNNAGVGKLANVEVMEESTWDETLDIDLRGVYLCSKYAIPELRKNGGSIVNMSSLNGILAQRGAGAYCAAKAGVILLTKVMALELAPDRIRVNCICPGDVLTGKVLTPPDMGPIEGAEAMETLRRLHPSGRLGVPEDIAKVALFLASEDSSWVTGQAIVVDGGYSAEYLNVEDIIELGLKPGEYRWKEARGHG